MSWPEYVEFLFKPEGMAVGAILSNTDGKVWAEKGGFALQNHKVSIQNLKGENEPAEIQEWQMLQDLFKNQLTDPNKGYWLNGKKFVLINFDDKTAYLRCHQGGACISKTEKTYVVGIYQNKEDKSWGGGECNSAVEELAEMLRGSKY